MFARDSVNNRVIFFTLALTGLAFTIQGAVLGPILVDISETFGVSVGLAGQLTTVSNLSVSLLPLLGGPLIDRYPRRLLMVIGCLTLFVSALGTSVAPNFVIMLLVRLIGGMGIAIMWPAALAVAGESVAADQQGLATGWAIAGSNLGQVIGALTASFIAASLGWRWAFVAAAVPALLAAPLALWFLPTGPARRSDGYLDVFLQILGSRTARNALVATFFFYAALVGIRPFFGAYLIQQFGLTTAQVGLPLSAGALGAILGALTGGQWMRRNSRRVISATVCLVMGPLLLLTYNVGDSLALTVVTFIVFGFIGQAGRTAVVSLTRESAPASRATMMAGLLTVASLGIMASVTSAGVIISHLSYGALGPFLALPALIASAIFIRLIPEVQPDTVAGQ